MIEPDGPPTDAPDVKHPAARPGRLRRWMRAALINGALFMGSLLFVAVVMEIAIRIALPQQLIMIRPDLWTAADTVGWMHHPNVDIRVNTGERTVRVLTDSAGFRVGDEGRIEEGRKVLVLGDSFMEALQVEYDSSVPGLLQKLLRDSLGVPVAIRNAGMADYNPNQYRLRARSLLPREAYSLVLTAIYVGNDMVMTRVESVPPRIRAVRHSFHFPRNLSRREIISATLRPLNDALEVRSHLYVFVRKRMETLRMRLGLHPVPFPREFLKTEARGPQWAVTADLCREISDLAQGAGAASLFVMIPAPSQVDPVAFAANVRGFGLDSSEVDLDQPNRLLAAELARHGLNVLDVLPAFREAHQRGVKLFGSVDPHLSPEGNQLLAQLVTPVAAGLLRRTR